jgi:hypothetical protein
MREEVIGDWRKVHNEELHDFAASQMLFGWWTQVEWDQREAWHVRREDKCMQSFGGETWRKDGTWKT